MRTSQQRKSRHFNAFRPSWCEALLAGIVMCKTWDIHTVSLATPLSLSRKLICRGRRPPMGPRIDGSNPTGLNTFGADSSDAPTATVRLGETSLAQVAQRLGLDPDALQHANPKIVDPSKLTVGQELRLPLSMKPPSSVSDSATSPSSIPGPPSDPMAKVMAQMQLGGLPQQSAGPSKPVMFNSPVNAKEKEHDRWLNELGHRPDEAHEAWKNLSPGDRLTVI